MLIVVGILQQLVLELKMDPETLTEEEKQSDEALAAKTKVLLERNSKIVAEREKYRKVLSSDYHSLFFPFFKYKFFLCLFTSFENVSQKTWLFSWMFFAKMLLMRHIQL